MTQAQLATEFFKDDDGAHAYCDTKAEAKALAAEIGVEATGDMIFVETKKGMERLATLGLQVITD